MYTIYRSFLAFSLFLCVYAYALLLFILNPSAYLLSSQAIFADLAKICSPNCVLATNTSTLDVDAIASAAGPDRVGSVR